MAPSKPDLSEAHSAEMKVLREQAQGIVNAKHEVKQMSLELTTAMSILEQKLRLRAYHSLADQVASVSREVCEADNSFLECHAAGINHMITELEQKTGKTDAYDDFSDEHKKRLADTIQAREVVAKRLVEVVAKCAGVLREEEMREMDFDRFI